MNKLIDIYRLVNGIATLIYSISKEDSSLSQELMSKDEVTINIVTDEPIYLQEGDYILVDGIKYKINRDAEDKQTSEKKHSYTITLESPIYTLIDKYFCNKITGNTSVTLTGKLRDFLELLIWNVNYDATSNPLGVDTGWTIGLCPDTDYMNITLNGVKCRDVLDSLASNFNLECYATNKTINFVSHIENETGLVFTQGKGEGLYEVERKNVDDGDLVTRVYAKGGTDNVIPGEGDSDGRLVLPEGYIENFSESNRVVEAIVEFDNIHPTFQGTVGALSGDNSREFICSEIDANISDWFYGDGSERVNFLTGDLMGKSFEFKWDYTLKKITLIYQEDDLAAIDTTTGKRPNIPSAVKYLRGGELFNFTGIKLSGTYKTNAITKLREKATDWLSYYCRKRIKFELNVDYRYLREHNIELHCGDLITINVPLHNVSKLIRIISLERNLYTGKLTCTVSNYLDEKWKDKIETEVNSIKTAVTTVNGGSGATSVTILEKNDERSLSDSNVLSSLRALLEIANRAISKTGNDSAAGIITFLKGLITDELKSQQYTSGTLGSGMRFWMQDGKSYGELDNLSVRMQAVFNKLTIVELKSVGGQILITIADMECLRVEELDTVYRCYFDTQDGTIPNQFAVNDQARCQTFTGKGEKYYWRLVVAVGSDYIDLSKTDCDGSGVPAEHNSIIQLGNRSDSSRQDAILLSAYGVDAPSIKQYYGIHSFSLAGCEGTVISPKGNKLTAGANHTRIPADRGVWSTGMVCNYYDRVSNNGALWLCVIEEGTTTTEEPSTLSTAWEKQVSEGISKSVSITGENIFKYADELTPTPVPDKINLFAAENGFSSTQQLRKWQFKRKDEWITIEGAFETMYTVLPDSQMWNGNSTLTLRYVAKESDGSGEYSDTSTITKLTDGKDSYSVLVLSDNGNIFKNGVIDTTMHAILYKGGTNITEMIPEHNFSWFRTSADADSDILWNSIEHKGKTLHVTGEDVSYKAVFNCDVTISLT